MNSPTPPNSFKTGPDENGMFGIFGGRFVAETLMPLILELLTPIILVVHRRFILLSV